MKYLFYISVLIIIAVLIILWKRVTDLQKEVDFLRAQTLSKPDTVKSFTPINKSKAYTPKTDTSAPSKSAKNSGIENWLGRNVLGISASILIFVGLVFLGTLVYRYFSESVKIAAMYLISTVISGLGIFLTYRNRNNFTLTLTGCGAGAFFISILLTHIYFNKINDITAFSLILVWTAVILFLSKLMNAIQLSVTAHIGTAVSLCFAYSYGLDDNKLALVMVYQILSIILIIAGNLLCFKKTYPLGLAVSLAATVFAGVVMYEKLPTGENISAYAAQFLCASILSCLLAMADSKTEKRILKTAVQIFNKAAWVTALLCTVYYPLYDKLNSTFATVMISLLFIAIHVIITLLLSHSMKLDADLEIISVLILAIPACILLYAMYAGLTKPLMPFFIVVSLVLLAIRYLTGRKAYTAGAFAVLTVDWLFSVFVSYLEMTLTGTIALSLGYMVMYPAVLWTVWLISDDDTQEKYFFAVRLTSYLSVIISLISIFISFDFRYSPQILLIVLTALSIALHFIRFERGSKALNNIMHFCEVMFLIIVTLFMLYERKTDSDIYLYLTLTVLNLILTFQHKITFFTGIKLTGIILSSVERNTSLFNETYIFSVICMCIALICIILGFIFKQKGIRLYGLLMTLFCVLKLVTFDVVSLNSLLRVVALIGGGIICFIISAIYNYSVKKLLKEQSCETQNLYQNP